MNELIIFENKEFGQVRTITEDGKILFCGKDVAVALGYKDSTNAMKQHCKGVVKHHLPTSGGSQLTNFIPEGDIYRLAAKSELPGAERFESWVFDEVLPSIRQTGGYALPQSLPEALRMAADLAERNTILALETAQKDQIIGELKPLADYCDLILKSKGTVAISLIAKDYGMSARGMNKLLHELGVQYRQGETWLLYAKYQAKGYTHSKTFDYEDSNGRPQVRLNTEWTQKGRIFLYHLLKDNGYLPLIEQDIPA